MADISWPVNDQDFWLSDQEDNLEFDVELTVKRNGGIDTLSLPGARWRAALTFPDEPVSQVLRRRRQEAFLASLRGGADRLLLWNLLTPEPLGTMRGTVTLGANVSAGATAATLAGGNAPPNLLGGPSFEVDSDSNGRADRWAGYSNGTTGTVSYSLVAGGVSGAKFQRISADGIGTTSTDQAGVSQTVEIPGQAGLPFAFSAYVRGLGGGSGGVAIRLYVDFYNGAGGTGSVVGSSHTTIPAGSTDPVNFVRYSLTGATPSGALSAIAYVWMQERGGATGGAFFDLDDAQYEQASAPTTFGNTATLLRGDRFAFGGQRFKVTADATLSDGAGTVNFQPAVRAAASLGAAVTLVRPTSRFVVTSPLVVSKARGNQLPGFVVELIEAP